MMIQRSWSHINKLTIGRSIEKNNTDKVARIENEDETTKNSLFLCKGVTVQ